MLPFHASLRNPFNVEIIHIRSVILRDLQNVVFVRFEFEIIDRFMMTNLFNVDDQ